MVELLIPEYRNPSRNGRGTIDCEINHPKFGWIPFTVDPDDAEPPINSAKLYAAIQSAGGIAEHVPPPPKPTPPPLTDDQKFERLAAAYDLTPDALSMQIEKRRPARSTNGGGLNDAR